MGRFEYSLSLSLFLPSSTLAIEQMRQSGVFITTSDSALLGLLSSLEGRNYEAIKKLIKPANLSPSLKP
ncbi:unnamed protein product [Protopolystoma xenopodis]|uniref:Uncharacterized protein n=1 Tax=Protopolystoma xenopodis TaxID=117903 RepID=A0A3S5CP07_9PLAT|nr:unnamed protein product [Protopolystoma xenopodis]